MNDLIVLILSLSSDEVDDFIALAKAKNQRSDVKNIKLFRLLRNGARKDLDVKIYGKPHRKALHALTNRLKDNLVDFTATKGFESEAAEDLQVLKLLLASRLFLEAGQHSLGFKTLKKAIATAQTTELYAVLQECYHTQVQYAHLDDKADLDAIITAYKGNQKRYEIETRLVMAYATLNRKLANHPTDVFQTIKGHLHEFDIRIDEQLSFKSLFQIITIATDAATLTSDYAGIALFMNHIYEIVQSKNYLAERHLYYHCEILYLISGTYFRNKDFKKSQQILEKLEQELEKQKGRYKQQFLERLSLLKTLNYNYTCDALKAVKVIDQIKKPSARVLLVHTMLLFQQENFRNGRRKINELKHSDSFYEKKEGLLFVLQKNVLEIIIYIELNQPDLVESRMRSFKKRYRSRLLQLNEHRVFVFMNLLRLYFDEPFSITEPSFKEKVEKAFEWKTAGREDLFVMSFYAYLKAKMERKSIYDATVQLANQKVESPS